MFYKGPQYTRPIPGNDHVFITVVSGGLSLYKKLSTPLPRAVSRAIEGRTTIAVSFNIYAAKTCLVSLTGHIPHSPNNSNQHLLMQLYLNCVALLPWSRVVGLGPVYQIRIFLLSFGRNLETKRSSSIKGWSYPFSYTNNKRIKTVWKEENDRLRRKKKWTHVIPKRERKKAATSISNGFPGPCSDFHGRGYAPCLCHPSGPFRA